MTRDELLALLDHFSASALHRMEYEEGGVRLMLEKAPPAPTAAEPAVPAAASAAAPVPAVPAAAPKAEDSVIKAPLVGTYYAASSPDAAPYVRVGDRVEKGQTLCLIEAMKTMNEIPAPCDLLVEEILVDNGALVAFDAPILRYSHV